jgi:ABC-type sugar transport system substrate-binding protein
MSAAVARDTRRLLAGEPVERRAALRAGAGAVLGLSLSPLLAACGTTFKLHANTTSYVIDATGTSPPASDLARLIAARARSVGMAPSLTATGSLQIAADLRLQSALGPFDPQTNRTPAVSGLIAVGAVDPGAIGPILATAIRRGVNVVSYPLALRHRTAAIVVDPARGATTLAAQAAAWMRAHGGAPGKMLLVLPSPDAAAVNPYATQGPAIERAVRAVLARRAPEVALATTTGFGAPSGRATVAQALAAEPDTRVVLAWDDDTALGAAQALRTHAAARQREPLYVGALGAPAVTSRATFRELERGDVLRVVVAASPRDLANALVDLPHALLGGRPARDVILELQTLTPRSPALAKYSRDYALHPPGTNFENTQLNPAAVDPPG